MAFAVRLVGVRRDPGRLSDLWSECEAAWGRERFAEAVRLVTPRPIEHCDECATPVWADETYGTSDGASVCEWCRDDLYATCYHCEELCRDTQEVGDDSVCSACIDRHYSWCDDCDRYVDRDHWHECTCEAPFVRFSFPANGQGAIANDCRLTLTLPAGVIDETGIADIVQLVHRVTGDVRIGNAVYDLDHHWVTREGNFTKRLARLLFKVHSIKLPPDVISAVGNLARAHSSDTSTWHVEFTRELNAPSAAFYNDGSCWWGDHSNSRCALKTCGGLALRSYNNTDCAPDAPNGRAWVIPLDSAMQPTHSTKAPAYVVFNEYGALEGYAAARVVARLTAMTYARIDFIADPMYVNGDTAFLVADPPMCESTKQVSLDLHEHSLDNAA